MARDRIGQNWTFSFLGNIRLVNILAAVPMCDLHMHIP